MMCASTVQVAALPGEVVSNTGKQNRKVLAAPVMGASASAAGATTLLRQKHGNCLHLSIFLYSISLSFPLSDGPAILSYLSLPRTVPLLVPQR